MKKYNQVVSASAMLLASMSVSANIIDLFDAPVGGQAVADPDSAIGSINVNTVSQSGPHANVLGGYRDLIVDAGSGASDVDGDGVCDLTDACSRMVVDTTTGILSFSNDSPDVVGIGAVQWDGDDSGSPASIATLDETGLRSDPTDITTGIDFRDQDGCPAGGCDRLEFEVVTADLGFDFTIELFSDPTEFTKITLISSGDTGTTALLFHFLENPVCGGSDVANGVRLVECGPGAQAVNFDNISAMQVIFNVPIGTQGSTAAVDLSIRGVTKTGVPEPSSIALLGLGMLAGGLARKKIRKKV